MSHLVLNVRGIRDSSRGSSVDCGWEVMMGVKVVDETCCVALGDPESTGFVDKG